MIIFFFLFLREKLCYGISLKVPRSLIFPNYTYVLGTHKKRLAEALLMSTRNIGSSGEIRKK